MAGYCRRAVNSRFDPFTEATTALQLEGEPHRIVYGEVELKEAPSVNHDIDVNYAATAVALTQVSSSPAVGEFWPDLTYNTGMIKFNTGENGVEIEVDYYGIGSPILAEDHNFGGGGYRSMFRAGFCGDGNDGASEYIATATLSQEEYQFTNLRVAAALTVGSSSGYLFIGVQGRLTLTDDAKFIADAIGMAGGNGGGLTGVKGESEPGRSRPWRGKDATTEVDAPFVGHHTFAGGGGGGGSAAIAYNAGDGGAGLLAGGGGRASENEDGAPGFGADIKVTSDGDNSHLFRDFLNPRGLGIGGGGGEGVWTTGGTGGTGGGCVVIECDELYLEDGSLISDIISAQGSDGGGGAGTNGGGGGGGGGGCIMIVCNRIVGYTVSADTPANRQNYLSDQANANGGAGGTGYGVGDGGDGGNGIIVVIELAPAKRN